MLDFRLAADLEPSVFLAAAVVVAVFLAAAVAAGVGRLISFLAGADTLLGCADVVLPEGGAVAVRDAKVLTEEGALVVAAAVEGLAAGREVGAVAGLEDFMGTAPGGFVEEVLGFGAVGPAGLLSGAVVLGLVAVSVFFGVPFAGLVPFVIVEAAAGPVGFLSGILT